VFFFDVFLVVFVVCFCCGFSVFFCCFIVVGRWVWFGLGGVGLVGFLFFWFGLGVGFGFVCCLVLGGWCGLVVGVYGDGVGLRLCLGVWGCFVGVLVWGWVGVFGFWLVVGFLVGVVWVGGGVVIGLFVVLVLWVFWGVVVVGF